MNRKPNSPTSECFGTGLNLTTNECKRCTVQVGCMNELTEKIDKSPLHRKTLTKGLIEDAFKKGGENV